LIFRIIIEHARGTERGSGGVPHGGRSRSSGGGEYANSTQRKQRARDKYE